MVILKSVKLTILIAILLLFVIPMVSHAAEPGITAFTVNSNADGTTTYSLSIKILVMMTLFTLLPAILMTTTSFTRIVIVLAILRQALGMPNIPTNQILIGLGLFITLFVMSPVFVKVNDVAIQPYLKHQISESDAIEKSVSPFKSFMLRQTREADLKMFASMSGIKQFKSSKDISMLILMPSFLTSELKTAFQMGFLIFLPFLIIDIVVASVLMSMGMMMLSPLVISLPFKIMLFVLVNGWVLVVGTLAASFGV